MSATPSSRTDGNEASISPGERAATKRIVAVTRDGELARALQDVAGAAAVIIVPDLRALADAMLRHGSDLALLDAAAVEEPLDGMVDALTSQFPDLRLMVAGQTRQQALLASRIADETVFRFIHKPASPQRLKLFLEAAGRDTRRRTEASRVETAPPRPPSRLAFILAGLAAICIAAAAWLFWPEGAAARLNARDLTRVEDMLEQAGQAVAARHFASFDGTSGAELYRDVLQLDAVNEPARTGLDQALDGAIGSAWRALAAGQLDDAANSMEAVRLIAPAHRGLTELVTAIEAETGRRLADATERELMAERQRQIKSTLEQMTARIQAGALLDPESDNAIIHFEAAQSLSAGDPAVRAARNELTASLVTDGEKALRAGRLRDARRHAAAASQINSSAAGLAALYRRIQERQAPAAPPPRPASTLPSAAEMARTLEVLVQTVPPPPEPDPAPPAPAPVGKPAWVPGEGVVPAGQLEALRRGAAEYPPAARIGQITGWVELEFTVARNGSVKDIQVTASEPRRTFDSAAIAAMRDYRYAPVLRDGQPVEQRARLRFNFRDP